MSFSQERLLSTIPIVLEAVRQLHTALEDDAEHEDVIVAALTMRNRNQQRSQVFMENILPSLGDDQFKQHFRLSAQTFEFVLAQIATDLAPIIRNDKCSPDKQLLIALWRFATPDSYRSIVLRFGVAKATGIKAVDHVSRALLKIAPRHIIWPTGDRALEVSRGFVRAHGFPGVIGAIDGTHIVIPAPPQNSDAYVNRKSKHSIHCQLVCDHQRLITNVYVGHVGSVHDARVFRLSPVFDFLTDPTKFSGETHIIGDAAYPLSERVLVPYMDNGHLSHIQKNFNYCHSSTRMVIERTNGLLKGRWRSLLHCLAMTRIDMIPYHVMACCVLHNICLIKNEEIAYVEAIEIDDAEDELNLPIIFNTDRRIGETKRTRISQLLPNHLNVNTA